MALASKKWKLLKQSPRFPSWPGNFREFGFNRYLGRTRLGGSAVCFARAERQFVGFQKGYKRFGMSNDIISSCPAIGACVEK
jgi:hypothetical protein